MRQVGVGFLAFLALTALLPAAAAEDAAAETHPPCDGITPDLIDQTESQQDRTQELYDLVCAGIIPAAAFSLVNGRYQIDPNALITVGDLRDWLNRLPGGATVSAALNIPPGTPGTPGTPDDLSHTVRRDVTGWAFVQAFRLTARSAPDSDFFLDLGRGDTGWEPIQVLASCKLYRGYPNGNFEPTFRLTVSQAALVIHRWLNDGCVDTDPPEGVPSAPTVSVACSALRGGGFRATLSWSKPAADPAVSGFRTQTGFGYSPPTAATERARTASTLSASWTVAAEDVAWGRARAVNSEGESAWSEWQSADCAGSAGGGRQPRAAGLSVRVPMCEPGGTRTCGLAPLAAPGELTTTAADHQPASSRARRVANSREAGGSGYRCPSGWSGVSVGFGSGAGGGAGWPHCLPPCPAGWTSHSAAYGSELGAENQRCQPPCPTGWADVTGPADGLAASGRHPSTGRVCMPPCGTSPETTAAALGSSHDHAGLRDVSAAGARLRNGQAYKAGVLCKLPCPADTRGGAYAEHDTGELPGTNSMAGPSHTVCSPPCPSGTTLAPGRGAKKAAADRTPTLPNPARGDLDGDWTPAGGFDTGTEDGTACIPDCAYGERAEASGDLHSTGWAGADGGGDGVNRHSSDDGALCSLPCPAGAQLARNFARDGGSPSGASPPNRGDLNRDGSLLLGPGGDGTACMPNVGSGERVEASGDLNGNGRFDTGDYSIHSPPCPAGQTEMTGATARSRQGTRCLPVCPGGDSEVYVNLAWPGGRRECVPPCPAPPAANWVTVSTSDGGAGRGGRTCTYSGIVWYEEQEAYPVTTSRLVQVRVRCDHPRGWCTEPRWEDVTEIRYRTVRRTRPHSDTVGVGVDRISPTLALALRPSMTVLPLSHRALRVVPLEFRDVIRPSYDDRLRWSAPRCYAYTKASSPEFTPKPGPLGHLDATLAADPGRLGSGYLTAWAAPRTAHASPATQAGGGANDTHCVARPCPIDADNGSSRSARQSVNAPWALHYPNCHAPAMSGGTGWYQADKKLFHPKSGNTNVSFGSFDCPSLADASEAYVEVAWNTIVGHVSEDDAWGFYTRYDLSGGSWTDTGVTDTTYNLDDWDEPREYDGRYAGSGEFDCESRAMMTTTPHGTEQPNLVWGGVKFWVKNFALDHRYLDGKVYWFTLPNMVCGWVPG